MDQKLVEFPSPKYFRRYFSENPSNFKKSSKRVNQPECFFPNVSNYDQVKLENK